MSHSARSLLGELTDVHETEYSIGDGLPTSDHHELA